MGTEILLWEKNLSQYSPMGAWLTIAFETLVQSELECLKNLSYSPPLEYNGSTGFKFSSRSSKKCWPLLSEAWKIIFQLLRIVSHLLFLLKSYKDLHKKLGTRLNFFIFLSTVLWSVHLQQLGQSQNSMELL